MRLGLLQLCLILLWVLKTQAQNSTGEDFWNPSLSKAPLQPNFQGDKFQGEWYAIGWAQNTLVSESLSDVNMLSTTFELNNDHSYNVTSIWFSEEGCTPRLATLVPSDLPGQYIMEDAKRYKGLQNLTMKVVETDYNESAVVFYKAIFNNKVYIECIFYARNRMISNDRMDNFTHLAISMGFRRYHVLFTILKTGCNMDYID